MALPIKDTPILVGKDASDFLRRIESDLKRPATYTPTPNLWRVKKIIKNSFPVNSPS